MSKVIVCPLFSGSSGNSTFVATESTAILVDAGMNAKRTKIALSHIDASFNDINGIIITHEHFDHIRGIGVLSRQHNLPIYANEETWREIELSNKVGDIPIYNKIYIKNNSPFSIGDINITGFSTFHDVAQGVGYVIEHAAKKAVILTDTGQVTDSMKSYIAGCDVLMIESNHDEHMLRNGKYPVFLKRRILSRHGHLSNYAASKVVAYAAKYDCRNFILAHLSDDNNTPEAAYDAAREELAKMGLMPNRDVNIQIARKEIVTEPIII